MSKEIKLKACSFPWLRSQIEFYEDYGYELIEIRPARWYEFPNEHIAIMEVDSLLLKDKQQ